MNKSPTIVGAGLAGLLAAHAWPGAAVLELAAAPAMLHKAVLRFRTENVARLTGIDFRRVRVHKGIWHEGAFHAPNVMLANLYAEKVIGRLAGDRSIWNIEPVDRFIAPDTFYEQMIDAVGHRITWNCVVDFSGNEQYISTAPLNSTLDALGTTPNVKFERAPITVVRGKIPGADVFQTVYFPGGLSPMYRASITGDNLIIEAKFTEGFDGWLPRALNEVQKAFGIRGIVVADKVTQKYGKIAPADDAVRKQILFELTQKRNIFSLGRFATWRNILLDDVVDDIQVLKRLMRADSYDQKSILQQP